MLELTKPNPVVRKNFSDGYGKMKDIIGIKFTLVALAISAQGAVAADNATLPEQVDLNDSRVTPIEKKLDEAQTKAADKFAAQQAETINKVPGVEVSVEDLKEAPKKKGGFSINPIRWIFGPVIKLQEQTVRLQQQMMKLTGPIAALQPAMLTLQGRVDRMGGQLREVQADMRDVRRQMKSISGRLEQTTQHMTGIDENMGTISGQMSDVQKSLKGTHSQLLRMGPDIASVRSDIAKIRGPITKIEKPLTSIAEPITNLDQQVTGVHDEIKQLRSPIVNIQQPITSLEKQLTGLSDDISALRNLLSLVLTSIFVAALMIAVGTPIAAIFIWRAKNKILPKPKPGENSEDELATPTKKAVSSRR